MFSVLAQRQGATRQWILILALLTVAAALRLAPYQQARADGSWLLADGDSYYHLRRIEQTIKNRGQVPMFDPALAYPEGQRIQWHGGYDLLIAGAAMLFCGSDQPRSPCVTTVAVLLTPLLGTLTTLLVLFFGWTVAGRKPGFVAAALFAVYPWTAGSGTIGHIDHHVLEPLLVAAWFFALAKRRVLLAGALAGLASACFPTALWPVGVTVGVLGIERLRAIAGGQPRDLAALRFTYAALVFTVPVVYSGAFADRVEPAATSLFHLLALGAAVVTLVAIEIAAALAARLGPTSSGRPALWAALGAAGACTAMAAHGGSSYLQPLLRFGASGRGLWTGVVQQASLTTGPLATGVVVVLLFAACAACLVDARRRERPMLRLVALATVPLALAGVGQIRFLMAAGPLLALVLANALTTAWATLDRRLADEPARTRMLGRAVKVALVLLLATPLAEYRHSLTSSAATVTARQPMLSGVRLLKRLRQRIPPGIDRDPPSVLSDWRWGHHILYFAELPTVASPFILSGVDRFNVTAKRALLSEDVAMLHCTMIAHRSRYLLISALFDVSTAAASVDLSPPSRPLAVELMTRARIGSLRLLDTEGNARLFELPPSAPAPPCRPGRL